MLTAVRPVVSAPQPLRAAGGGPTAVNSPAGSARFTVHSHPRRQHGHTVWRPVRIPRAETAAYVRDEEKKNTLTFSSAR